MQNELVEVNRDCYRLYLFLKMFWLKKKNLLVGKCCCWVSFYIHHILFEDFTSD